MCSHDSLSNVFYSLQHYFDSCCFAVYKVYRMHIPDEWLSQRTQFFATTSIKLKRWLSVCKIQERYCQGIVFTWGCPPSANYVSLAFVWITLLVLAFRNRYSLLSIPFCLNYPVDFKFAVKRRTEPNISLHAEQIRCPTSQKSSTTPMHRQQPGAERVSINWSISAFEICPLKMLPTNFRGFQKHRFCFSDCFFFQNFFKISYQMSQVGGAVLYLQPKPISFGYKLQRLLFNSNSPTRQTALVHSPARASLTASELEEAGRSSRLF